MHTHVNAHSYILPLLPGCNRLRITPSSTNTLSHIPIPIINTILYHQYNISLSYILPLLPGCNRLRITADGKLKVCLFGSEGLSLLDAFRSGKRTHTLSLVILCIHYCIHLRRLLELTILIDPLLVLIGQVRPTTKLWR